MRIFTFTLLITLDSSRILLNSLNSLKFSTYSRLLWIVIFPNLNHVLVVGVPVSQGALGEDGDVGEHVEESQPGPHVCRRTQVVGAEREVRPKYNFNNFNLLKTTMNVRRRPSAM